MSLFNHQSPQQQQQSKSNKTGANTPRLTTTSIPESAPTTTPYVYIDHEKTTTLKDIAHERLQQQQARRSDV